MRSRQPTGFSFITRPAVKKVRQSAGTQISRISFIFPWSYLYSPSIKPQRVAHILVCCDRSQPLPENLVSCGFSTNEIELPSSGEPRASYRYTEQFSNEPFRKVLTAFGVHKARGPNILRVDWSSNNCRDPRLLHRRNRSPGNNDLQKSPSM
jgi:hypothetical protein